MKRKTQLPRRRGNPKSNKGAARRSGYAADSENIFIPLLPVRIGQGRTDTQEMNSPKTSRTCFNCGTQVDSRYCPSCGQEYGSTRITWRSLYDEAVSIFIGDSIFSEKGTVARYGMLQTLWNVIRHPAATIEEYFAGKQCKYVSPLTLLLLVCTICLLTLNWFDIKLLDFTPANEEDELGPLFREIGEFLSSHLEVIALLRLPGMALACVWFFRKPPRLRFMEFFYIGLYLASLHIILLSVTAIFVHTCDIAPEGTVYYLLNRIVTVTLFAYNIIILRYLLRINWIRATVGYLFCLLFSFASILAASMAVAVNGAVLEEFF